MDLLLFRIGLDKIGFLVGAIVNIISLFLPTPQNPQCTHSCPLRFLSPPHHKSLPPPFLLQICPVFRDAFPAWREEVRGRWHAQTPAPALAHLAHRARAAPAPLHAIWARGWVEAVHRGVAAARVAEVECCVARAAGRKEDVAHGS